MSSSNQEEGNLLFPVFFRLDKVSLVVIGGGAVGLEKTEAILRNNGAARIKLVAPEIREEIQQLASKHKGLELVYKPFSPDDLDGADLIISATCIKALNAEVHNEAKRRKIICNVADTPDLCDFYMCSVVKKGDLKLGISTNGKSPTFAKRMRELLDDILPSSIHELLANLNTIRDQLKGDFEYKVKKMDELTSSMRDKRPEE